MDILGTLAAMAVVTVIIISPLLLIISIFFVIGMVLKMWSKDGTPSSLDND